MARTNGFQYSRFYLYVRFPIENATDQPTMATMLLCLVRFATVTSGGGGCGGGSNAEEVLGKCCTRSLEQGIE